MYAKKCLELARTKYPNNENLMVAYMLGLNDGYSQGEEDLIEKACKFLFENYHGEKLSLRMINDFKNYMEGK